MNNKKYIPLFLWSVLFSLIVFSCDKQSGLDGDDSDGNLLEPKLEVEVHKVWEEAPYSTSSDLIRFKDAFYCAFRESSEETGSGGRVRVVKSLDGVTWETVQVFEFTDLPIPTEPADYLSVNGVDQYMKIPHHTDFDYQRDEEFSLSSWVYNEQPLTSAGGAGTGDIVSTRHANNVHGYNFSVRSDALLILDLSTPYYRRHQSSADTHKVTVGNWHHIGFTYDGPNNTVQMYLDGQELGLNSGQTNTLGTQQNDYGNDITVFARATNRTVTSQVPSSIFYKGRIQTLRFWNKAMTEAEMAADMRATVDAATPDLIAGYDFASHNLTWTGTDWIVPDIKGNHPGILHNFSFALYGTPSADLRAPRLSIAPGNRLMLQMYGEYDRADGTLVRRRPYISFSDDGETFSDMVPSEVYHPTDNDLSNGDFKISGVTWDRTSLNAYGFDYTNPLTLFKTTNGTVFRSQKVLTELNANVRDVQVRFDKRNKMYVLISKDEGDQQGILAVSAPPYTTFEYHPLDFRVHSPHFVFLDEHTLVMATQDMDNPATLRVLATDLEGKVLKEVVVTLEEGIGYPEGIAVHDKYLWLSYGASQDGRSGIGLVKIPLDDLKL